MNPEKNRFIIGFPPLLETQQIYHIIKIYEMQYLPNGFVHLENKYKLIFLYCCGKILKIVDYFRHALFW